ncbi:sigma-70 family RNA polymerase sigma factor [Lignipirellula cremea]|uniref:sigma-70 family RNA polymerase sigma factor n=1 Tax=Lignipirellula cremea TaxID=2528010 RepID=UPI0018D26125|nr:sigma-70 family RNA polymerase sigma factor [Lignipirellula cremea]
MALFVRHEPAIHSFVLTLLTDRTSAEDVMQQASLTMWRRFDQYRTGSSFRNWAFQVAKFTAMNHLTKVRRDRHVFSQQLLDLLAEQAIQRSEQLEAQRSALAFCLEKLKEEDRRLLAGCYGESSTIKAFAETLGQSANAVYKRLNRIRDALLGCIQRRLGLETEY